MSRLTSYKKNPPPPYTAKPVCYLSAYRLPIQVFRKLPRLNDKAKQSTGKDLRAGQCLIQGPKTTRVSLYISRFVTGSQFHKTDEHNNLLSTEYIFAWVTSQNIMQYCVLRIASKTFLSSKIC